MAFYDKFPYTNFQEINLDRIIQQLLEVQEGLQFVIDNASLKYADPIQWNITHQYQANTVVIDPATGIAYISTKPVPDNILITDAGYWTPIFDLSEMFETIKESICFNLETGATSSAAYATGSYIFVDNILYKVISDITPGSAFAENVNIQKVCVTDLIQSAESDIVNLNTDVGNLDGRVDAVEAAVADLSADVIDDVNEELTYKFNSVFISTIRADHPDYTDDQLMSAAIQQAVDMGSHPTIIWDHHDADFSGAYTFDLSTTSGIDFNHQTIYMPPVDAELFYCNPDDAENKNVSSAMLGEWYVSDSSLYDKYFAVNSSNTGSSEMCAGSRYNNPGELYVCYGIVTDPKGQVVNDKLNYLPATNTVVPLYNVHSIPDFVTVFKNANVVYPASDKMAVLFRGRRSRIHISNIHVSGYTNVTAYHTGVLSISSCAYIEVDHIYGSNPIQEALTSGYLLSLFNGCTDIHIHDCDMHDSQYVSWGMLGMNDLTNLVMERVNTSRFDCHYFAWGYITIRECHLDYINMCAGVCNWTIENCMLTRRLPNLHHYISLRSDSPGRFNGALKITNCRFRTDPSAGASAATTRVVNLSMVHNLLGNFTATAILNASANVYISDCNIENALCVLQCEDIDSGNGTSVYQRANFFISNTNINILSNDYNTHVAYKLSAEDISAINILSIKGSQIRVSFFSNCEIDNLMVVGCTIPVDMPIKCSRLVTNCIFNDTRFAGFDITLGTMFTNLVCVGCYVGRYQTQWSSGLATNYVFMGNASRDSGNIANWINSNSYGV